MPNIKYPHTLDEVAANIWEETTLERYDEMLGVLPPQRQYGSLFLVGECLCHLWDGSEVYTAFIEFKGKFYTKPVPESAFDLVTFRKEIQAQLDATS